VLAAARKWKRQLSAESAECCRTRDASRRPSREAPARTATGERSRAQQVHASCGNNSETAVSCVGGCGGRRASCVWVRHLSRAEVHRCRCPRLKANTVPSHCLLPSSRSAGRARARQLITWLARSATGRLLRLDTVD